MICAKCGYLNNDNDKFCGMCGEAILVPVQERQEEQEPILSDFTGFESDFSQQDFSQQDFSQQDFSQQDFSQQDFSQQYFSQQGQHYAPVVNPSQPAAADPGQTLGIVALVTGVLSILTSCCTSFIMPFLSILSIPFAIAALVCGAMGMKKSKEVGKTNVMAIIGLIIGILSVLTFFVTVLFSVLGLFGMGAAMMYEEFF